MQETNDTLAGYELREETVDLMFDPIMKKDVKAWTVEAHDNVKNMFEAMDLTGAYDAFFDLFWKSNLPCFDTHNHENPPFIKDCKWKGRL